MERHSGSHGACAGSDAINWLNLCVAASPDIAANLAASSQGSTSKRASAETTLSGNPLRSSRTGAYRKSSKSDGVAENRAERVTSTPMPLRADTFVDVRN